MKLNEYLLSEQARTDFLETASCIGIVASNGLVKKIDKVFKKEDANIKPILDQIKDILGRDYDWDSAGAKKIRNLKVNDPNDFKSIVDLFALIRGMNTFMNEVGKKIVGNSPKFVHSRIKEYYDTEIEILGEIPGSKANTADCVVTNVKPDKLFAEMRKGPIESDKNLQYVKAGNAKYIQVSLKKSEKGAQLGKITNFLKMNLGFGGDTEQAVQSIVSGKEIDKNQEIILEGILGEGILDRIKNIASNVWDKFTDIVNRLTSKLKKKYTSIFKKPPKKEYVDDFFREVGISEETITEGKITASTQKIIDEISKNPSSAILAVNKQLKRLKQLAGGEETTPITIQQLSPVKKFPAGSESTEVFSLISNYLTVRTLMDMFEDSKDISKTVRRLIAEMLFGGTKLPLWKVYGDYGNGHAYTYLGTIDTFVKSKPRKRNITVEVMGVRAAPTDQHYTIMIMMLEEVSKEGKTYVNFRTGTNSSSRISFVFEGTKVRGPYPLDTPLLNILVREK